MAQDPLRSIRGLLAETAPYRWAAVAASVLASVLLVLLVPLLYLFVDLLVWQGRIPDYDGLPAHRQAAFRAEWDNTLATDSGVTETAATLARLSRSPDPDWSGRYRAATHVRLRDSVSAEAAELYLPVGQVGPTTLAVAPGSQPLGLLSLAARERSRLPGDLVRGLARVMPWTWRPNPAGTANPAYLTTLLLAAVGLVAARGVVSFFAGSWAAADRKSVV